MRKLNQLVIIVLLVFIASPVSPKNTWTQSYGGASYEWGHSAIESSDETYLIVGETSSYGAGSHDIWLIKTDRDGDTLWIRTYGGSSYESANLVIETSDQAYLIVGETSSYGLGIQDIWLVKTDRDGDTLWTRTYGGNSWEEASSVIETSDQAYLIAGTSGSNNNILLIKTDMNGDTLWTRTYGGDSMESACEVIETSDQAYLIAGRTISADTDNWDIRLIKTDMNGNVLWTQTYGGSGMESVGSVIETSDQNYLIAGRTTSFGAGETDFYLVKTDMLGHTTPPVFVQHSSYTPSEAHLYPNYPNPFNPTTNIEFRVLEASHVLLEVFDMMGRSIEVIVDEQMLAGQYHVQYTSSNLASGIYLYRVQIGDYTSTQKMVITK